MTISIWRFSHLTLALISSLFLLIAASTGIILSFEPISNRSQSYSDSSSENVPIANIIDTLRNNYLEVISLERDQNDYFIATVFTDDGDMASFYINPKTAKKTGDVIEQSEFYAFITTLHRSLFLDSIGRFFIGICATLLLLIAISGIVLIFKRQKSFKSFFKKIENANFYQYSHVSLGRLFMIPILLISLTGSYLFLQRFGILEEEKPLEHQPKISSTETDHKPLNQVDLFKNTKLSDINFIEFPFSPDEEDYFFIKQAYKEIYVHQYTGRILSSKNYPFPTLMARLSLSLHTGRDSIIWAIVLGISSICVLYFIYSGFAMTLKRRGKKTKNTTNPKDAEIIILFGSENGNSKRKAMELFKALQNQKSLVYLSNLNDYQQFESMTHLVIITSTYGTGDAPSNANKFIEKCSKIEQIKPFTYSVVGFGSHAYPDFCQFAVNCEHAIDKKSNATKLIETAKIHNQNNIEFLAWSSFWSQESGISLSLQLVKTEELNLIEFEVLRKTSASDLTGDNFLLELRSKTKIDFRSGDLLNILPENEDQVRQYSIGKTMHETILLSIKKHERGVCSNFLHDLNIGQTLIASIEDNSSFHFPDKTKNVILVANGTGIAPFLGMLNENRDTNITLYWGGKSESSLRIFQSELDTHLQNNNLSSLKIAYSRSENSPEYVWHLIQKDSDFISTHLKNAGAILICGSIAMQNDVLKTIDVICENKNLTEMETYIASGQILTDCY